MSISITVTTLINLISAKNKLDKTLHTAGCGDKAILFKSVKALGSKIASTIEDNDLGDWYMEYMRTGNSNINLTKEIDMRTGNTNNNTTKEVDMNKEYTLTKVGSRGAMIKYMAALPVGEYYMVACTTYKKNITKKLMGEAYVLDVKGMPSSTMLSTTPDAKAIGDYAYDRSIVMDNGTVIHGCATGVSLPHGVASYTGSASCVFYKNERGGDNYYPYGLHWIAYLCSDSSKHGATIMDVVKHPKYTRHPGGSNLKSMVHGKEISYGTMPIPFKLPHVRMEMSGLYDSVYSDGAVWSCLSANFREVEREVVHATRASDAWVIGYRYTGPVKRCTGNVHVKGAEQHLTGLFMEGLENVLYTSDDNIKAKADFYAGAFGIVNTFSKVKSGSLGGQPLSCFDFFMRFAPQVIGLVYKAILAEDFKAIDSVKDVIASSALLSEKEAVVKALLVSYKEEGLQGEELEAAVLLNSVSKEKKMDILSSRLNKHTNLNFAASVSNMLSVTMDIYGIIPMGYVATNCKAMGWDVKDGDIIVMYRSPAGTAGALVSVKVIDTAGGSEEGKLVKKAYGSCHGRVVMGGGIKEAFEDNGLTTLGGDEHRAMFREWFTQQYSAKTEAYLVSDKWATIKTFAKALQVRFGGMDYDNDTAIVSNVLRSLTQEEREMIFEALKLTPDYDGVDAEGTLDGSVTQMELDISKALDFFKDKVAGVFGPTGVGAPAVYNQGSMLLSIVDKNKSIINDIAASAGMPVGLIGDYPEIKALFSREQDWKCGILMTAAEGLLQAAVDNKAAQRLAIAYLPVFQEMFFGASLTVKVGDDTVMMSDNTPARYAFCARKVFMPRQLMLRGFGPGMSARFCETPNLKDPSTWYSHVVAPALFDKHSDRIERIVHNNKVNYVIEATDEAHAQVIMKEIDAHTIVCNRANTKSMIENLYHLEDGKAFCSTSTASKLYDVISAKVQAELKPLIIASSLQSPNHEDYKYENMLPAEFKIRGTADEKKIIRVLRDLLGTSTELTTYEDKDLACFIGLESRKSMNNKIKMLKADPSTTEDDYAAQRKMWSKSWVDAVFAYCKNIDIMTGVQNSGIHTVGRVVMSFISGHITAGVNKPLENKIFMGMHPVMHVHTANVVRRAYVRSIFDPIMQEYVNSINHTYNSVVVKTKAANLDLVVASKNIPDVVKFNQHKKGSNQVSIRAVSHNNIVYHALDGADGISLTKAFYDSNIEWVVKSVKNIGKYIEVTMQRVDLGGEIVDVTPVQVEEVVVQEETNLNSIKDNTMVKDGNNITKADSGDKNVQNTVRDHNGPVFLTGEGGTGKTYLINQIKSNDWMMTASTGIAATHINGSTIHTAIGWKGFDKNATSWVKSMNSPKMQGLRIWWDNNYGEALENTTVIVIDEISMLDYGMMEFIDAACRMATGDNTPFGGKKIIFTGDFYQLEPVQKGKLSLNYLQELGDSLLTVNLTVPHRQSEAQFLDMLGRVRRGVVMPQDISLLLAQVGKFDEQGVDLYGANVDVDTINTEKMTSKCDMSTAKTYRYEAFIGRNTKKGPVVERVMHAGDRELDLGKPKPQIAAYKKAAKSCLTPISLVVAKGARVLITRNDNERGIVNGDTGTVLELSDDEVLVHIDRLDEDVLLSSVFTCQEYLAKREGKRLVMIKHLPIKLGYAFTVHKSQGMSIPKVNLKLTKAFACGQFYVALSRCSSLSGLALHDSFNESNIRASISLFRQEVRAWEFSLSSVENVADLISNGVDRSEVLRQLQVKKS